MRLHRSCLAALRILCAGLLVLGAAPAQASIFQGEALDTFADVLTVIVLILVPILAIVVFWLVHILPELIAEKRHHPQKEAITTLCLLSLVFGGLLWPLAWLWAYTKPVGYRVAYGTDKHDDYYDEMEKNYREGKLLREELWHLREDLDAMNARGALPPKLQALREELILLRAEAAAKAAAELKPTHAQAEKGQG